MNKERAVALGQRDHVVREYRVALPRQCGRGGRFSCALGSHKGNGFFAEGHRARMQARHAAHAQHKSREPAPANRWPCLRPLNCSGQVAQTSRAFPIQPELRSVEVGEAANNGTLQISKS